MGRHYNHVLAQMIGISRIAGHCIGPSHACQIVRALTELISQLVGLESVQLGVGNSLLSGRIQAHGNDDRTKKGKDRGENANDSNVDSQFRLRRSMNDLKDPKR